MVADYEKSVEAIIEAKNDLFSESAYLVLNEEDFLLNSKALLGYKKNSFQAKIISSRFPSAGQHDDPYECLNGSLKLHRNGRIYSIDVEDINDMSYEISDPCIVTYSCHSVIVDASNLDRKLKHVLLMEIEDMPTFPAFELKNVQIGSITHYRFFSTIIHGVEYHTYCHENKDLKKVYFFIESMDKVSIGDFKESINAIRFLVAIFNGDWYRGDMFIYSNDLENTQFRDYDAAQYYKDGRPIVTGYTICNTLKCTQYLDLIKQSAQKATLCCRASSDQLSTMCSKIYGNYKLQRIIELLLEATKTRSVVLKTSVYAIALETLANIVLSEAKNNLGPIQDKKLVVKMEDKFLSILKEYDSFMSEEAARIYGNRIRNLNKPANFDRIAKSFEIMGIELNDHDQETLRSRNRYLHGSTPIKNFENDMVKERELQLLAMKFRMLLVMQLVKFLGYNGHIWNHYGEIKAYENKALSEHLIRFV